MKKLISLLLALIFIFSAFSLVIYAEDDALTEHNVSVVSTEYAYDTCFIYADAQNRFFMNIDDIVRYTRSEYTKNSDGKIKITHGAREFTLDIQKKAVIENNRVKNIEVIKYNNKVLIHAFPMLSYLGADCDVSENRLVIAMPSYTFWEALELTGFENYITKEAVFGSELSVKFRLFWGGILKFLDSGLGKAVNAEFQAVLKALQVDVSQYDAYFDLKAKNDMKDLELFECMSNKGDMLGDIGEIAENLSSAHKIISVLNKTDPAILSELNDFSRLSSAAIISSISSISETLKASKDSFDVVSATLRHMSEDARFYNNLTRAQKKLKSAQSNVAMSIYSNTVLKAITEELSDNMDDMLEGVLDSNRFELLKKIGKSGRLSVWKTLEISINIGTLVEKFLYGENSQITYVNAEINVIELLRLKEDLADTMDSLKTEINAGDCSVESDLNDYRLLRIFYYRTLIALNEQFEAMIVAQLGKGNRPEMRELIGELQNQSNLFAEKLYMLTVADFSRLPSIADLSLKNGWDGIFDPSASPDDENKDDDGTVDSIDPPENAKNYWTFDYSETEGHRALMRVYCDDDGKTVLIEKYPLFGYEKELFVYNLKNYARLTCSNMFGMVSEKYVFTYRGSNLEKVTYYHTSEDHLGVREFKKGYVMKFEKLAGQDNTYKGKIYADGMPTSSYDIFEYRSDCIVRTIYKDSQRVKEIQYSLTGRPEYIYEEFGSNADVKYLMYDERGNIQSVSLNYRGNPFDKIEEYIFSIENDKVVAISYDKLVNSYQGTRTQLNAELSYDSKGRFTKASIKYPTNGYEVILSNEYDDNDRLIKTETAENGGYTYSISYTYGNNGKFDTVNYSQTRENSSKNLNFDIVLKYVGNNLTEMTYPEYNYSLTSFELKTIVLTYNSNGKVLNDGFYEYEYYPTGELRKRSELNGDSYTVYHKNGLKKEEKYKYSGYQFTDYYNEVDFNYDFGERSLYWHRDGQETVSTSGSSTATKSISIHPDGTKYEIERTFNAEYILQKKVIYEYNSNGILKKKITYEYDENGWLVSSETLNYDENGNVVG